MYWEMRGVQKGEFLQGARAAHVQQVTVNEPARAHHFAAEKSAGFPSTTGYSAGGFE
jgi:hypothetical protein